VTSPNDCPAWFRPAGLFAVALIDDRAYSAAVVRGSAHMPFSSLKDPVDLARATAALEKAWAEVKSSIALHELETERTRLAYIVAGFAMVALDEDDLVARSVERFRK
jgi:hypothetical protein